MCTDESNGFLVWLAHDCSLRFRFLNVIQSLALRAPCAWKYFYGFSLDGLCDEVFEGGVFAVEASIFWDSLCLGCC